MIEDVTNTLEENVTSIESEEPVNDLNSKGMDAIKDFVSSLSELYGKQNKPLALYNRLLTRTMPEDSDSIERHIETFRSFFRRRGKMIKESQESFNNMGEDDKIKYGQRIYIEIGHFVGKSSKEIKTIIRQHLLTIMAILNPEDSKAMKQLESINIDTSTREGSFINDIMTELKETVDVDNPSAAISNIMTSGMIPRMFTGLEKGFKSGEMDIGGLFKSIQGTMTSMLGPEAASLFNPQAIQSLVEKTTKMDPEASV